MNKKFIKVFKRLNQPVDANKVIEKSFGAKNYFRKSVFIFTFIAICSYGMYALYAEDFDFSPKFYMYCNSDNPCINTWKVCNDSTDFMLYYQYECNEYKGIKCEYPGCELEYVPPHQSVGEKLPNYNMYVILIIVCGFLANHLVYIARRDFGS